MFDFLEHGGIIMKDHFQMLILVGFSILSGGKVANTSIVGLIAVMDYILACSAYG